MTYEDALSVLTARQETKIVLGLARVRAHLKRLGDPQELVPAFHIAGTNGKGATCAILASVLQSAGYRVGLYISPHLRDVRERITINGRQITKTDFARLMRNTQAADPQENLTYFELLTSMAFQHFAERRCDVAVLETGLGGLLDATNVISRPLAAIVTSIDFDHMSFLGKTLPQIARQKAGIFKNDRPAIFPDIAVMRKACVTGRPVPVTAPWKIEHVDWRRGRQSLRAPIGKRYVLSLLGSAQGWNVALAHTAIQESGLKISEKAWRRGLARVSWPGRFQTVNRGKKNLIIDGAHNPAAARALAATWKGSPWSKRPSRWIVGVLKDKDAAGVVAPLAKFLRDVVVVRPPSPRAMEPAELARVVSRLAPKAKVSVGALIDTALAEWLGGKGAPSSAVCAGSLYLAGGALSAMGAKR